MANAISITKTAFLRVQWLGIVRSGVGSRPAGPMTVIVALKRPAVGPATTELWRRKYQRHHITKTAPAGAMPGPSVGR